MKSRISIVVVSWNSGVQLLECIQSIENYGSEYFPQVIVVDNGSVDGSEREAKNFPSVTLIRAGKNLGFGKACNWGAYQCDGEFILFLNPDAALYPETLKRAIDFIKDPSNAHVGICGVQLLDENNKIARTCSRFPTFWNLVSHVTGVSRFFPTAGYLMTEWPHDHTREVDHVIGAFYLVRRRLFDKLGGFDERFFVYLEDLDFSFRARQAGWKSVYLADAQAFHAGGGTSRQVKAKRLFYSLRSRLLYGFKHFPTWQAWMLVMLTCLVEPFTRLLYCVLRRDWAGVSQTVEAYHRLFIQIPSDRKKYWGSRPQEGERHYERR